MTKMLLLDYELWWAYFPGDADGKWSPWDHWNAGGGPGRVPEEMSDQLFRFIEIDKFEIYRIVNSGIDILTITAANERVGSTNCCGIIDAIMGILADYERRDIDGQYMTIWSYKNPELVPGMSRKLPNGGYVCDNIIKWTVSDNLSDHPELKQKLKQQEKDNE